MSIGSGFLGAAVGTIALDVASYVDMALRGRPASTLPTEVVKKLAALGGAKALLADDDATKNRQSGIGALLGYAEGLAIGTLYGAVRPALRAVPWPIAGLALGGLTLVASEGTATKLGATDWSTWSAADWISDIIPRSIYGLAVAAVVEALDARSDDSGSVRYGSIDVGNGDGRTYIPVDATL